VRAREEGQKTVTIITREMHATIPISIFSLRKFELSMSETETSHQQSMALK